ncbi:MAG: DCC1-like thiol-disulfide oxidoreductase family protein [Bacteroidia bacterium]
MNIFKSYHSLIGRLYDKKIDATGLALFRIAYFIDLFCEVSRLFRFRHLLFENIAGMEHNSLAVSFILIAWMIVIGFLTIGMFTRFSAVLNYIFGVIILAKADYYAYHMYYVFCGMNLLILFLPVSRVLSIDRLFGKLKYSNTRFQYEPTTKVTALAYLVPVMVGIAFVYFDSIFYKFVSWYWLHGLGMWLPSSLPFVTISDTSFVLNSEYLMKFIGYLTLVFEFVFLFFFFRRKWRVPLLIVGVGLHLGILIEFPIPFFAIGVVGLYLLLVPVKFWGKFNVTSPPVFRFYYDAECPLCVRTKIVVGHFDLFKRIDFVRVQSAFGNDDRIKSISYDDLLNDIHGVDRNGKIHKGFYAYRAALSAMIWAKPISWLLYIPGVTHLGKIVYGFIARNRVTERCTEETCGYTPPVIPGPESEMKLLHTFSLRDLKVSGLAWMIAILTILQISVSLNGSLLRRVRRYGPLKETFVDKGLTWYSSKVKSVAKPYLGITNHPVFMDYHFKGYNHIVSVVYDGPDGKKFLPIIDVNGQPGEYLLGPTFVNWTFRVNNAIADTTKISEGIKSYSAFWAYEHHLPLRDLHFWVMVKKIDDYTGWQKDFLKNQMAKPWNVAGEAEWKDGVFHSKLKDIEKM